MKSQKGETKNDQVATTSVAFGFGLAYGIIAGLLVIALAVLLGDYRRTGRPLIARVETVG